MLRMNHRTKLLKPFITKNEVGEKQTAYTEEKTVFGKVDWKEGTVKDKDGAERYMSYVQITTRHDSAITEKHRFEIEGNQYRITSIIPEGNGVRHLIKISLTKTVQQDAV